MCTAISFKTKNHFFGRTLDHEVSFGESILIAPKNYELSFRKITPIKNHFEATNECGLSMAGLNFPGNACYYEWANDKYNVTPFELIPWILAQCASVKEAIELLKRSNIVNIPFSASMPLSPLHWFLADRERSVTVETLKKGMYIYDNTVGVLTNNPPFDYQMFALNQFINVSASSPETKFAPNLALDEYSRGMGAIGLPGDLSSGSRFVRAVYTKENSICGDGEMESVSQFFHIMGSVAQTRGSVVLNNDQYEITQYTSCYNTDLQKLYITTYENSEICCVDLHKNNIKGKNLLQFKIPKRQSIQIIKLHKKII